MDLDQADIVVERVVGFRRLTDLFADLGLLLVVGVPELLNLRDGPEIQILLVVVDNKAGVRRFAAVRVDKYMKAELGKLLQLVRAAHMKSLQGKGRFKPGAIEPADKHSHTHVIGANFYFRQRHVGQDTALLINVFIGVHREILTLGALGQVAKQESSTGSSAS